MSELEAETTPFQSHSNTDNYLAAPCVSKDTNPAKYQKENHRKYPYLAKLAKKVPESCRLSDDRFKQLMFIRCNNVPQQRTY